MRTLPKSGTSRVRIGNIGLLLCEAKYNSSSEAKVVLLIVVSVIKFSEKVFDLRGANSDVVGYGDIKPSADGHCIGAHEPNVMPSSAH